MTIQVQYEPSVYHIKVWLPGGLADLFLSDDERPEAYDD